MTGRARWKRLRLSLLFAAVVFAIMLAAMALVFGGALLLGQAGLLTPEYEGRVPFFYFSLVSLLVGTVLAFAFSNRPLRPLREIMDAVDRVAAGDFTARLDLRSPEEFRELSDKFNHMAEQLGSVEVLRGDFVSNVSHEFKTPVSSIRGFAEQLRTGNLTPEEREDYLRIIEEEAGRLADLSANVLALSKLESQPGPIERERFDLTEQLRRCVALLDAKMEAAGVELDFQGDEVCAWGNEEMLAQVWVNLLDNAVKFSPAGGRVGVIVEAWGGGARVTVTNEGPDMPPEVAAHAFDRFYQGDASHSAAGNGLGLSIVKAVVDLHGGDVSVTSGEGVTAFAVKLHGAR